MTDEISETTRLSALLVFTSGFLTVVLCVFIMLRVVLVNFGESIFQNYENAGVNGIYASASSEFVSGPEAYNIISNGLESVLEVKVRLISSTNANGVHSYSVDTIYQLDADYLLPDNLKGAMNRLFTSYSDKKFVVGIEEYASRGKDVPYLKIILTEVE